MSEDSLKDSSREKEVLALANEIYNHIQRQKFTDDSKAIDALALVLGKIVKDSPTKYDPDQIAFMIRRHCIPEGSADKLAN